MQPWEGPGADHEFVISQNILRRHLDQDEVAMAAAASIDWFVKRAKERQVRTDSNRKKAAAKKLVPAKLQEQELSDDETLDLVTVKYDDEEKCEATEQAAKKFDVSPRLVADAKKVLEKGTEQDVKDVKEKKKSPPPMAKSQAQQPPKRIKAMQSHSYWIKTPRIASTAVL